MSSPSLVEPSVKQTLATTLNNAYVFKEKYRKTIYNFSLFIFFIIFIFIWLYVGYKTKPTPEQIEQQKILDEQFIMSKLYKYRSDRLIHKNNLITDLPHYQAI